MLCHVECQPKKKVHKMTLFVVFVYLRARFSAPSLMPAATNDINLFNTLRQFKTVHKKVLTITSAVINRHT